MHFPSEFEKHYDRGYLNSKLNEPISPALTIDEDKLTRYQTHRWSETQTEL